MESRIQGTLEKSMKTKREKDSDSTKASTDSVFIIHKESAMKLAFDILAIIGTHKEITLRARVNSILNAVTVANIITQSMLKGNSKIHKITVSSQPIQELGKTCSAIEIILKKI